MGCDPWGLFDQLMCNNNILCLTSNAMQIGRATVNSVIKISYFLVSVANILCMNTLIFIIVIHCKV